MLCLLFPYAGILILAFPVSSVEVAKELLSFTGANSVVSTLSAAGGTLFPGSQILLS